MWLKHHCTFQDIFLLHVSWLAFPLLCLMQMFYFYFAFGIFKFDHLSMPRDNQLRRARIGIYNSNQLHQFNNLKTNPTHFVLKFLNFYMTTVCLIPLTYFSVCLILAPLRNYGFNFNRFNITNPLLIKYIDFAAMSLILLLYR